MIEKKKVRKAYTVNEDVHDKAIALIENSEHKSVSAVVNEALESFVKKESKNPKNSTKSLL